MSSEWKTFVLRDVASIIGGGTPSTKEATYWDGNIPWLTPKDLSSHTGMYVKRGERCITKAGLDGSSAKIVPPGTVLFTSRAPIGYLAIAEQAISTNQGFKSLVLNTEQDNRFFYYLLRFHTPDIEAIATGSTFKEISGSALGSFEVTIPSYGEQTKIADILTTLDDRIALLRETNTTLEAIAQALFKSWFVDFDPVRAKQEGREPEGMDADTAALFPDSFEESELGLVPKGWKVGVLGDIAVSIRKQIPTSELNTELSYIGLEHMPRQSLSICNWDNAQGLESAKAAFSKGDILFGKLRPYFHKVIIAPFEGVCSTDILVCRSKHSTYYGIITMHLFSIKLVEYANRLSNGAKMPRVNWKDIAAYTICIPSSTIAKKYSNVVIPLFERMMANVHTTKTLESLRDTLLPRLISGQLRIPEAEALIEETSA